MGFYINQNSRGMAAPSIGKERFLIEDGAIPVPDPKEWKEGLVCIVSNFGFDAAGYAYSEKEMNEFQLIGDNRPKTWVYYSHAKKLSRFS